MTDKVPTYYQISRERANKSREAVCAELAALGIELSVKTLFRYEQQPTQENKEKGNYLKMPDKIVMVLVDMYNDPYLAYISAMESPVARMFIPAGVEPTDLHGAGTDIYIALENIVENKDIARLMQIVRDNKISFEESVDFELLITKFEEIHIAITKIKIAMGKEM